MHAIPETTSDLDLKTPSSDAPLMTAVPLPTPGSSTRPIASVETWSGDDDFGKVRSNGFNHRGYPLSNLFDGNTDSLYISRIFPLVRGAYVDVDFDGPVIIDEIVLTTRSNTIRSRDR